jgi:HAD superfamily hydrolase (TIGR01509 family)
MTYELIIFDCDGVLVDSEPISNALLAECLTAVGLPTTTEQCVERYMGGSLAAAVADAERRLGRRLPERFAADFNAACFAVFDEELEAVAGIEALLDSLDGVPTCVASSGAHEKLRRTLGRTGLLPRFEGRIFSASDVARGKPAPDLFLHAAERMGADPARCAVIEDSPMGVAAAVAAGMSVFGYAGRTPRERLVRDGVTVFGDMAELRPLLRVA